MARLSGTERRTQLLAVARRSFAQAGFQATSMEAIAEAAGVTKPVLYQHFGSKRQLYRQLLEDVGAQLADIVGKATGDATGPREQVEAGFTAYFRFVTQEEDAFRLVFGPGTRQDAEFADLARRVESSLAEAIATLIDADIDPDHRLLLGHGIVGLAEGTARQVLEEGGPIDPDLLARRTAALAWAGLRGVRRD